MSDAALSAAPCAGKKGAMQRRSFLIAGTALAAGVAAPPALAAEPFAWKRYEVVTEVDLSRPEAPADLWLPIAKTVGSYQRAEAPRIEATGTAKVVRDARYGEAMAHVRWSGEGGPRTVRMVQTVSTRDRVADPAPLTAAERRAWTAPLPSLPVDGIVKATADRITAGRTEPKARLRAIYDWVVDNTHRDPEVRGCGFGDVKGMLESGRMGGKCADINSLMVALARASGIPARDAYGVRVGPSAYVKQLGATGDVTRAQHCRAEMWLAGEGWFPVDPADVRKLVLEAKMPIDSAELKAQRERLFGSWEMNWIVYNHATDVVLPGAPTPPEEHFLMYPLAITAKGEVDQLDAKGFSYKITSTQLA